MTTADEVGDLGGPRTIMGKGSGSVLPASKVMPQLAAAPAPTPAPIEIISAIVPVLRDEGAVAELHREYKAALAGDRREIEFLTTVDHALRNRIIVELNVRLGAAHLALGEIRKGHGLLDVAIEGFDRRVRLGADEPFTRYYAAAAHALKGDVDTALVFLERAAGERRAFTIERARIEPEFASLRSDPRFQRLLM